jgi:sugar/nucleoside kinase (ribokinase family)
VIPVAIVGNINLDIKTGTMPASRAIFEDGETSASEIYETLGGGGANTALAVSMLGGSVHFFGCVGNDELGRRLELALVARGISPHLAVKGTATGRSLALHWDNGHRHFLSSLPNNRAMALEDIDLATLQASSCPVLLRADIWFSEAMLAEGNMELLRRARAAGIETYLDINWDPEWSVSGTARVASRIGCVRRILPYVNYAHGNVRELAYFTGCDRTLEACRTITEQGCGNVVVHRGAAGAAQFNEAEGWTEVPAVPVSAVTNPTGCGDVFCAAHMLHRHLPVHDRLAVSAAIASSHLSGIRPLIPRL